MYSNRSVLATVAEYSTNDLRGVVITEFGSKLHRRKTIECNNKISRVIRQYYEHSSVLLYRCSNGRALA